MTYTEFDINKRCAEISMIAGLTEWDGKIINIRKEQEYNPCTNQNDTWPIIEKIFDELHSLVLCVSGSGKKYTMMWKSIMSQHNCTKLVAACICFIELNT